MIWTFWKAVWAIALGIFIGSMAVLALILPNL